MGQYTYRKCAAGFWSPSWYDLCASCSRMIVTESSMDSTYSRNYETLTLGGDLRTMNFGLSQDEWKELETQVAAIPVVGDRYNAEQQKQVGR